MDHFGAIEKRLWSSADNLRANSNFASNEYFMPVMGLIFLRHAYSRFLMVREQVEATLPKRGGKARELTKADFSQKGAIFLQPHAQFEYLAGLPDSEDRAQRIIDAMDSIEADYENLKGTLPKQEYQQLETFERLLKLVAALDEEEQRAAKEQLPEDALPIFDLLRKNTLTPAEIKKIKSVAVDLYDRLLKIEQDIANWRATEGNRDRVRQMIFDALFTEGTGLPNSYADEEIAQATDAIYQFVYSNTQFARSVA